MNPDYTELIKLKKILNPPQEEFLPPEDIETIRSDRLRYEEALKHLANTAFATKDWKFAVAILYGKSLAEAIAIQSEYSQK